ncbi:uncharacterized protein V2V93DRAFT_242027 [Kockiozyma suomiensis]|uniref:uncharacterized protein n=1 Tax=Kockiozyma suomiensis TaxID=1337062 RepID=UPI003343DA2D
MVSTRLLRSKKKKQAPATKPEQSSAPGPTIQLVSNPDDDDYDDNVQKLDENRNSRMTRNGFIGPDAVSAGGLIQLIPSDTPQTQGEHESIQASYPQQHPEYYNSWGNDSDRCRWEDYSDGATRRLDMKISARPGAQRRTAMATYRSSSYKAYEQHVIDDTPTTNESQYAYNQDTNDTNHNNIGDNASEAYSFQSSIRYEPAEPQYVMVGYPQYQQPQNSREQAYLSDQHPAVQSPDAFSFVSEANVSLLDVNAPTENNSQERWSPEESYSSVRHDLHFDEAKCSTAEDDDSSNNVPLQQPRPRRISDIGTLTALSDSAVESLTMTSTTAATSPPQSEPGNESHFISQPEPRVSQEEDNRSRGRRMNAGTRPLSQMTMNSTQTLVHYPAPIPTHIKLPPLLAKKNSKKRLSAEIVMPLSAPRDENNYARDGNELSDSSRPPSTIPVNPGAVPMFQNPHENLDDILNNWTPEMSAPGPEEENRNEDFGGGPGRSLLDELKERKAQQKSRQRNLVDGTRAQGTLLQLDGLIERGQEKRRTVLNTYGLAGMDHVREGEDTVPLGVSASRRQQEEDDTDNVHEDERRKSRQQRVSSGVIVPGIPAPAAHMRQTSEHSIETLARSGIIMPSVAMTATVMPADGSVAGGGALRKDYSSPNLMQYYDDPATRSRTGYAASVMSRDMPMLAQQQQPQQQRASYMGKGSGVLRDQLHARQVGTATSRGSGNMNSEEALYKRLQERHMAMAGAPVASPKKGVAVSRMTQEGYDLIAQKQNMLHQQQTQQQMFKNQKVYEQKQPRGGNYTQQVVLTEQGGRREDAEGTRREVVERWRQSVYF